MLRLLRGLAVINDNAMPFNISGANLNTTVDYVPRVDPLCGWDIHQQSACTQLMAEPMVQSSIDLSAELGRNVLQLKDLSWATGPSSRISAQGSITNFSDPQWQFNANGNVALKQVGYLAAVDGLGTGTARLSAQGDGLPVEQMPWQSRDAPRPKHIWLGKKSPAPAVAPVHCTGYLVTGDVQLADASYRDEYVRLSHVTWWRG